MVLLNHKLKKNLPKTFNGLTVDEKPEVERLKRLLTHPPILALPRASGLNTVDIDACNKQLGFLLLQEQPEGSAVPIDYWLGALNDIENKPATTHKEFLAVAWVILLLRS